MALHVVYIRTSDRGGIAKLAVSSLSAQLMRQEDSIVISRESSISRWNQRSDGAETIEILCWLTVACRNSTELSCKHTTSTCRRVCFSAPFFPSWAALGQTLLRFDARKDIHSHSESEETRKSASSWCSS